MDTNVTAMTFSFAQLRGLIGLSVRFRGQAHRVIEVLEDEPALVLAPQDEAPGIQTDAYGNARRRARTLVTVPILTSDRKALHPEFLELDLT